MSDEKGDFLPKNHGVVVLCGGTSSRMGEGIPKQYRFCAGHPLIYWTLDALKQSGCFSDWVIVADENYHKILRECLEILKIHALFAKPGKERCHSVRNGLLAFENNTKIVAIHDGARPFPAAKMIQKLVFLCQNEQKGVIPVLPITDTIKKVDSQGIVLDTLERKFLVSVQTPQVFWLEEISKTLQQGIEEGFLGTDDSSYMERVGCQILTIPGNIENKKITYPKDFEEAEKILTTRGEGI